MKDKRIKPLAIDTKYLTEHIQFLKEIESKSKEETYAVLMKEVKKMYPDTSFLEELLERIDVTTIIQKQDEEGNTILHNIAWHDHDRVLMLTRLFVAIMILHKENRFLDIVNNDGMTALDIALEQESSEIAMKLILMEADIMKGRTPPLISALKSDLPDIARLLIEHGCDVHACEKNFKSTSLMWAIDKKLTDIALILIQKGVSVHERNHNGETPLTLACKNNMSKVVQALIKAGANPEHHNKAGWLPFQLCTKYMEKRNPELLSRKIEIKRAFEESLGTISKELESVWNDISKKN